MIVLNEMINVAMIMMAISMMMMMMIDEDGNDIGKQNILRRQIKIRREIQNEYQLQLNLTINELM